MSAARTFTERTARGFWTYFDVADEIYEAVCARADQTQPGVEARTTLADLDARFVAQAKKAAPELGLPWPPYLPDAEEFALYHRSALVVADGSPAPR